MRHRRRDKRDDTWSKRTIVFYSHDFTLLPWYESDIHMGDLVDEYLKKGNACIICFLLRYKVYNPVASPVQTVAILPAL